MLEAVADPPAVDPGPLPPKFVDVELPELLAPESKSNVIYKRVFWILKKLNLPGGWLVICIRRAICCRSDFGGWVPDNPRGL